MRPQGNRNVTSQLRTDICSSWTSASPFYIAPIFFLHSKLLRNFSLFLFFLSFLFIRFLSLTFYSGTSYPAIPIVRDNVSIKGQNKGRYYLIGEWSIKIIVHGTTNNTLLLSIVFKLKRRACPLNKSFRFRDWTLNSFILYSHFHDRKIL